MPFFFVQKQILKTLHFYRRSCIGDGNIIWFGFSLMNENLSNIKKAADLGFL